MSRPRPKEFLLLEFLDSLVKCDQFPAGFTGQICIGIRGKHSLCFWHARFGRKIETGFVNEVPDDVDAVWGLGASEAAALLQQSPLPNAPFILTSGNRDLLERFINRYISKNNPLSLQIKKLQETNHGRNT